MELVTPRLHLRRFKPTDLEDVLKYMSDPVVTHYLSEGQLNESEVKHLLTDQRKFFAIEERSSGDVVGHIEFYPWFGDHTYEIGWALREDSQGKGYGFEAASACLQEGFASLKLQRVIATCQPENLASVALAERLEMKREGHFRQCLPQKNGQWWDEYFYAMLKEDYLKLSAKQGW